MVREYTLEEQEQDISREWTDLVRAFGLSTTVKFRWAEKFWLEKSAYYPLPIDRIEIFRVYPGVGYIRNRAILAHEAGHAEQWTRGIPPPGQVLREIDAYYRGRKFAEAWSVEDEYRRLALDFAADAIAEMPFVLIPKHELRAARTALWNLRSVFK